MDSTKQVQINPSTTDNKDTFFTYTGENTTHSKEKENKIAMISKWQTLNKRQNVDQIIKWHYHFSEKVSCQIRIVKETPKSKCTLQLI